MLDVSEQKILFRWICKSGAEIPAGHTMTKFAETQDGILELERMRRWCNRTARWNWFGEQIEAALKQDHLRPEVMRARARLDRKGARVGRSKADRRNIEANMSEANAARGLMVL